MVIYLPVGSKTDHTRPDSYYNETWKYFQEVGIEEI